MTWSGKLGFAPCGHVGRAVIGQYYACDICDKVDEAPSDGVPVAPADDRVTEPLCHRCGGDDLDVYPGFTVSGKTVYHCRTCQHTWP